MKKFTILMLMAALAIPAMQARVLTKADFSGNVRTTTRVATPSVKPLKVTKVTKMRADVPAGYAQITLVADDVWGDGSGYQMLLDADATAYGTIIPISGVLSDGDVDAATYAEFEYKIPENADGALSTANVIVSGSGTIQIPAGIYDWCITNPTPGDLMYIAGNNGNAPSRADDYEFASGASYVFTMELAGQGDGVFLEVDDPNAPTIPTNLTANPGATNAEIAWEAGANNATWNLRYRPYVEGAVDEFFEDFENFTGDGWYVIDADGDGNGWSIWDPVSYGYEADQTKMHGNICLTSASYNGAALTPDNWLITPEVILDGTLTFWACGQDASWAAEHFAVYAAGADWESTEDFVEIMPETVATGTITQYTVDLSSFNGELGCIAFRHFNVTDMFRLNLDDIAIAYGEGPAEWTVVEGVDNPYTIEGLTPETEYEVQVQGVAEDARVTDWTESTRFTTLADVPVAEIEELYLVGSFNGWNWQNEDGRVPFELEDGVFTVNIDLEDGDEFKLITPDENSSNGWKWFGGVDENNVGFFLINEDLLEQPIELVDGANFRIEKGGNFTITVAEARGLVEPLVMTVVNNDPTAITDINSDSKDNTWYNIQGMKLQGVPTVPGIYINGGRKVVVK